MLTKIYVRFSMYLARPALRDCAAGKTFLDMTEGDVINFFKNDENLWRKFLHKMRGSGDGTFCWQKFLQKWRGFVNEIFTKNDMKWWQKFLVTEISPPPLPVFERHFRRLSNFPPKWSSFGVLPLLLLLSGKGRVEETALPPPRSNFARRRRKFFGGDIKMNNFLYEIRYFHRL